MARFFLILLLLAGPTLAQPTVSDVGRVDGLLGLLQLRLRISDEVARAKWNIGAPVQDTAREAKVVATFVSQAHALGVDDAFAKAVIEAQIEASKIRQRELMASWRAQRRGPFPFTPDLAGTVRPRLDWLSGQLARSLSQTAPLGDKELMARRVRILWGNSLSPARRKALEPFGVEIQGDSPALRTGLTVS